MVALHRKTWMELPLPNPRLLPATPATAAHTFHCSLEPAASTAGTVLIAAATLASEPYTTPTTYSPPDHLTALQVLLVRDGQVIDRLGSFALLPDAAVVDWIAAREIPNSGWRRRRRLGDHARQPHIVTVTGTGHCGADWASAWAEPERYSLVPVMSVPWPLDEAPLDPEKDVLLVGAGVALRAS